MRQHILTAVIIVGAVGPLGGVMYAAHRAATRSPENLALADRCVAWAHKSPEARTQNADAIATQCDQYFRVRSERDADEDDQRWRQSQNR